MRFISPSFLSFALLMALLPWVEIRCEQQGVAPFRASHPVVEQNAFQVTLGDSTFNTFQQPGGPANQLDMQKIHEKQKEIRPAPLIGGYLGCVLVGAIVGFAVPARRARLIIMCIVAVGAVGTLLAQTLIGFPLFKIDLTGPSFQNLAAELGQNDPRFRGPDFAYHHGFTIWFYLAIIGTAGGAIGVLVDLLNPPKLRPWEDDDDDDRPLPRRRRRPRYEDDDDDYEDDDDYRRRSRRR